MSVAGSTYSELCVGIDLGTTNSVLAVVNQKPNGDLVSKVVELGRAVESYTVPGGSKYMYQKKPLLPSFVYYRPEADYSWIVGDYAKGMYAKRPHLVVKSVKSHMGEAQLALQAEGIPDATPAQVSSKILLHLLGQAGKTFHRDIREAVITVPANFDSAMCKATLEAAALAGVEVRREDGSEKPILLSEPNAVIYDLINQIRNGELHESILDLSETRQVMVFDIGGGTLDITLHTIRWRDEAKTILKVDEVATNRYTLLGGDDFDEVIAEKMWERYVQKYADSPAAVECIRKERDSVMAQMRLFAEGVKIELSNRKAELEMGSSSWGWDDEEEGFAVGGHMGSTGFAYDDYFTTEELESFLHPFMGEGYEPADYKRLADIAERRTIIYPILDVLQKAAQKLGQEEVTVDAVILNGGMSRFYMIQDRLTRFFGFSPIIALDPDQAVARGAAIYHYYLRLHEAALAEDMRLLGKDDLPTISSELSVKSPPQVVQREKVMQRQAAVTPVWNERIRIEFGRTILNEGLYLGLKNGAQSVELVATGQELPFVSPLLKGFKLEEGQDRICIPIQVKQIDGTMQTIAKGTISLKNPSKRETYVSLVASMSPSKVLTMQAWVSADKEGRIILEDASVTIEIGREQNPLKSKQRLAPPTGSWLRADYEIHTLLQLCHNWERFQNKNQASAVKTIARIRGIQSSILACSNPADFAQPVLEQLMTETSLHARLRLYTIGRWLCQHWTERQRKQLAEDCMREILIELEGFIELRGEKVNVATAAIMALVKCGSDEQIERLAAVKNPKLRQGLLYVFALRQTQPEWIYALFKSEVQMLLNGQERSIQTTTRSLGLALSQYAGKVIPFDKTEEVVTLLLKVCNTESYHILFESRSACLTALGWICDRRSNQMRLISEELLAQVRATLEVWKQKGTSYEKCCIVALKMLTGQILTQDDEAYLLSVVESLENV